MTGKIFKSGNSMALRLPKELNPVAGEMQIEVAGDRWIISPRKVPSWPPGFFSSIQLTDSEVFQRPTQGSYRDIEL